MYTAGALQQIECSNLIVLTLICIRNNNCVGVTAVVVKQSPHRAISMLGGEDLRDPHHRSVQAEVIIPACILPCRETNAAPISTVLFHCVACKFMQHKTTQMEMDPDTQIIMVENHAVPTTKRMTGTAASITVR